MFCTFNHESPKFCKYLYRFNQKKTHPSVISYTFQRIFKTDAAEFSSTKKSLLTTRKEIKKKKYIFPFTFFFSFVFPKSMTKCFKAAAWKIVLTVISTRVDINKKIEVACSEIKLWTSPGTDVNFTGVPLKYFLTFVFNLNSMRIRS